MNSTSGAGYSGSGAGYGGAQTSFNVGALTIPLFVGTVMNWALMGALAVQVFIYFHAFPHDRLPNKLIVLFVVVAELLQTLGDSHDTVQTFGAQWGNFNALDLVGWSWFSVPILGSAIGCVGQLFFAWRIYVIGARKVYLAPLIILIITIFQFGAGIWTGIQIIQAGRFSLLTFKAMKPPVAWLAATAAADILIVLFTAYYLLKARSPGFSSRTTAAVNRIIMVTIETGIPCAAFALVDLALFVKYQGNNYHLGTCIWLSKVYSNSILAILNSRAQIGHATSGTEPSVVNISGSHSGTNRSASASKRTASTIQFASSFPHKESMGVFSQGTDLVAVDACEGVGYPVVYTFWNAARFVLQYVSVSALDRSTRLGKKCKLVEQDWTFGNLNNSNHD